MQQTSTSHDCTDSIIMISTHNNSSRRSEDDKDAPIDHRLPSPEEQCLILASKYEHHDINIFISIFINMFFFHKLSTDIPHSLFESTQVENVSIVNPRHESHYCMYKLDCMQSKMQLTAAIQTR